MPQEIVGGLWNMKNDKKADDNSVWGAGLFAGVFIALLLIGIYSLLGSTVAIICGVILLILEIYGICKSDDFGKEVLWITIFFTFGAWAHLIAEGDKGGDKTELNTNGDVQEWRGSYETKLRTQENGHAWNRASQEAKIKCAKALQRALKRDNPRFSYMDYYRMCDEFYNTSDEKLLRRSIAEVVAFCLELQYLQ